MHDDHDVKATSDQCGFCEQESVAPFDHKGILEEMTKELQQLKAKSTELDSRNSKLQLEVNHLKTLASTVDDMGHAVETKVKDVEEQCDKACREIAIKLERLEETSAEAVQELDSKTADFVATIQTKVG